MSIVVEFMARENRTDLSVLFLEVGTDVTAAVVTDDDISMSEEEASLYRATVDLDIGVYRMLVYTSVGSSSRLDADYYVDVTALSGTFIAQDVIPAGTVSSVSGEALSYFN